MTKSELVNAVAERAGLNRAQAKAAVEAALGVMGETLRSGESVRLVGFGNFEPVSRPAGTARNPRTGETVQRPASRTIKFRIGDALRATL